MTATVANAPADRLVAHWRVRPQRDQHIEVFCFHPDQIVNHFEEKANGGSACGIGNDEQDLLAGQVQT